MNPGKIFFPNLNGLRFIAAAVVVLSHTEAIKALTVHRKEATLFINIGTWGVTLFFVLSGFLITYLLLAEKQVFSTISAKKFYMRRILRIWPLYYLIVILALFVFPHFRFFDVPLLTKGLSDNFSSKVILFFLILPNIPYVIFFPDVAYAVQTWSIGVEEQFYLIWPLIIKYFKNFIPIFIAIIIVQILLRFGLVGDLLYAANKIFHFTSSDDPTLYSLATKTTRIFFWLKINCMAIGAIGAYLLFYKKTEILSVLFSIKFQILVYAALLYLVFRDIDLPDEYFCFFFLVIILNLAANKKTILNLENPVFSYLGKISYGIYMFHFLAITLAIKCVQGYDPLIQGALSNSLLYFLAFLFSIAIASFSYYFFESWFLKLKHLFTKVRSGSTESDKI